MSTAIEPETCHHCGGSGREPTAEDRAELLAGLREIGERRALVSTSRTLAGITAREACNEDIRVLAAEAGRLNITKMEIAEAVGLKKATLYLVLTGKSYS